MMPKDLASKYIQFFRKDDAGKYFIERLSDLRDTNTQKARQQNSLDYLSRSAGNQEALDLIEHVIMQEEAKRLRF